VFVRGTDNKSVKNFVYDFREDGSKQFSTPVNNKYVCVFGKVCVAASKRSNAGHYMTMYKGFISQQTDNQVIKIGVFWSLSLDCTQSLRGCPTLKYLK
jgi:hypothetical protein